MEVGDSKSGSPVRLAIVEDHDMVREMLCDVISKQPGFEVAGSVGSLAEADELLSTASPDMIVLDIELPDGSGLEWARALKGDRPQTKIVYLTAHTTEETVLSAVVSGAEGYVDKHSSCVELLRAIQTVAAGQKAFDVSVMMSILQKIAKTQDVTTAAQSSEVEGLSKREREVAVLAANGMTNAEIAKATFLSESTVRAHLRRVFLHLRISSRRELIRYKF